MAFSWGNTLSKKLETIMYSMKDRDRGMHLRDFADELEIKLEDNNDKARLRYRIYAVKRSNKDLEDIGYTSDGYIYPVDADDYHKLYLRSKGLGDGHLRRAQILKAKGEGLPRKKSKGEQLSWDFGI